ncbi:MAG TPA: IPT/TIG domain-containing protein [Bryobacteraceae bacterium]|nr:IPT/TIG domain-containing protein [Bryobacteraceae bacterium]
MRSVLFLLAPLAICGGQATKPLQPREAPVYTAASIVNSADNQSGALAPNTIGTVYGKNLAYTTRALTASDIQGGILPTALGLSDVQVLIGGLLANLYYVSPTQVNFLVPSILLPGPVNVQLVVDSLAGPAIPIQLAAAAPGLFQLDLVNAVATRPDGTVVTPDDPAKPGDVVVLYATGLGQVVPPVGYGEVPTAAAPLSRMADLRLLLDGVAVDPSAVLYAGVCPNFAGLYQINLRLPASTGANPELRVALGDAINIAGVKLPVNSIKP